MSDKIRMKLIEKPANGTATIFETSTPGPAFVGEGKVDYICGMCKSVIAKDVEFGQLSNMVFRCYKCKRYNQC